MRTLIFGPMPEGATPATHIAAGAFCFAGREHLFPGWDGGDPLLAFPLPPDPYPDAASMIASARAANGEAARLAVKAGRAMSASLPDDYWLMALGPPLLLAAHMFTERQQRVLDCIPRLGGEDLRVPLLPPGAAFSFADSLDLMLRGVQDAVFNHYIYSRIVEAVAPPAWKIVWLPAVPLHRAERGGQRESCKSAVRRLLLKLPFPRSKGFSLPLCLLLSLGALLNRRSRPDASIDPREYCDARAHWVFDAEPLLLACLPKACLTGRTPKITLPDKRDRPAPLRGMSPVYMQDDRYRLRLARLRAEGCRLFSVQHGANYGNLACIGGAPFEYGQHAFITWGWKRHEGWPVNALPLPQPMLARLAGRHREREPALILVGTEMSAFSYRLKTRIPGNALPGYRAGKVTFLRAVTAALGGAEARVLYRPYFRSVGALEDAGQVLARVPGVERCDGDLTKRMLGCRLLVLDHYGTTLHAALAADVPCIAFWDPSHWIMEPDSREALRTLQRAGMLYDCPTAAAEAALAVWPDVRAWWRSEAVRKARAFWISRYARIGSEETPEAPDTAVRLARAWFGALRNL